VDLSGLLIRSGFVMSDMATVVFPTLHLTCITVIYILIANIHYSAVLHYPQWYQTFVIRIHNISELILSVRIY